jgi:hypothetical protein
MCLTRVSPVVWMATSILIMSACSRSGDRAAAQLHEMSIAEQAEIAKRYDPSALAEVTSISNLPADLKSHFKGWLGQRSEHPGAPSEHDDPGDRPGRFIIAGVSDTSALVAYEMFGYVPTTHATAYVHAKSDWVVAKNWDGVGYPKTLSELQLSIERFATPVSGHR